MAVLNGVSCMEYKNRTSGRGRFACAALVYSYHTNGVYVFAHSSVSNWQSTQYMLVYTYTNSQTLVLDVGIHVSV
jgi:hypothetical protein